MIEDEIHSIGFTDLNQVPKQITSKENKEEIDR